MLTLVGALDTYTMTTSFVSTVGGLELGSLNVNTPASGIPLLDYALATAFLYTTDLAFAPTPSVGGVGRSVSLVGAVIQNHAPAALAQALAPWQVSAVFGTHVSRLTVTSTLWAQVLESSDVFLMFAELAVAGIVFAGAMRLVGQAFAPSQGYSDIVTFCQLRSISVAEVFACVTFFVGFIVFDAFVTLAEDDVLEAVSYVFAALIVLAVLLLIVAVDLQYYYMISSVSGGELTLRLLYADFVNNALCLLRIFFCWIRYLFYDLQAELVDLAFHYTEYSEEVFVSSDAVIGGTGLSWGALAAISGAILTTFLDGVFLLIQLLIGAFKLALALFLFWLILDLFLVRTFARTEARWSYLKRSNPRS